MSVRAVVLLLVVGAIAVKAAPAELLQARGGAYRNDGDSSNNNDNNGKLVSVKNEYVGTIVNPTQTHYEGKQVSESSSQSDSYKQYNTESVLNLHKTIVNKDTYVKDKVHISRPVHITHVNKHHHETIVKHDHPVQQNLWVTRYQNIVKPAAGTVVTNSNSQSEERVTHATKVYNDAKSYRLPTIVKATQNLGTKYASNSNRDRSNSSNNNNGSGNNDNSSNNNNEGGDYE